MPNEILPDWHSLDGIATIPLPAPTVRDLERQYRDMHWPALTNAMFERNRPLTATQAVSRRDRRAHTGRRDVAHEIAQRTAAQAEDARQDYLRMHRGRSITRGLLDDLLSFVRERVPGAEIDAEYERHHYNQVTLQVRMRDDYVVNEIGREVIEFACQLSNGGAGNQSIKEQIEGEFSGVTVEERLSDGSMVARVTLGLRQQTFLLPLASPSFRPRPRPLSGERVTRAIVDDPWMTHFDLGAGDRAWPPRLDFMPPSPPQTPPPSPPTPEPEPMPPVEETNVDEIDLQVAGTAVAIEAPPEQELIGDPAVERDALMKHLLELIPLLSEAAVEIDAGHMLHAEIICSVEESRALMSRCENALPKKQAKKNPWGGKSRVRTADAD